MTYRVIIQPRAARDIWAAAQWLEDQSRSAAKALRLVRSIRAKIETLKANPKRCPVDPDSAAYGEEVRMLLYGKRQENTGHCTPSGATRSMSLLYGTRHGRAWRMNWSRGKGTNQSLCIEGIGLAIALINSHISLYKTEEDKDANSVAAWEASVYSRPCS
jgi:plasmid stabilization system protein ParE